MRVQKQKARLVLGCLIGVCMLSACSDRGGLESDWQRYQGRLTHLLNEDTASPSPTPMPIMPRSGDMRIEIDRLSINLLDSFRLDRCRLGQVIAQRNSALGNVQSTSARLRYELDSMLAIEECLATQVAEDPRLVELLSEALAHKRQTLPLYIDQVLTRSDEFRHAMRAANRTLVVGDAPGYDATLAALSYFATLFESALNGDTDAINLAPYNNHMQHLAQSDFLPRYWRTMQQNAAWLEQLNLTLTDAGDKIGCRPPSIPERATYLHNVMMNIFAAEIQPALARWSMYHSDLAPVLAQLRDYSVQGAWHAYVDELIAEGSHADHVALRTLRHARLWQAALAQCNMQPGRN
ncbi:Protein of unknown function (DUF3080) [Aliidiomarina maris]|uniref:DUF3080 family protein n=1 Tax=Aliidiomarina maris TaxID=531312 RepID=A0A327X6D5_9GAMM|nr:Protein of unknown function (DUF3080) [Aliidiomarina maris]